MKLNLKRVRGGETGTEGDRGAVVRRESKRTRRRTTITTAIAPIWSLQDDDDFPCFSEFSVYNNCRHLFFYIDETEDWDMERTCGILDMNTRKSLFRYENTRSITVFGKDKILEIPFLEPKRLVVKDFLDGKEMFSLRLSTEAKHIYTGENGIYAAVLTFDYFTDYYSLEVLNVKWRKHKISLHIPSSWLFSTRKIGNESLSLTTTKRHYSIITVGDVVCIFPNLDLGHTIVRSKELVYYVADMAAPVEELHFRPIRVSLGFKNICSPIMASMNKKFIYYWNEYKQNFVIFKTLCPEKSTRQLDLKGLTIKDASRHVPVFAEDGRIYAILNNQDFAVYDPKGGDPVSLFRLKTNGGEENLTFTILNHRGDLILASSEREAQKRICLYNVQIFLKLREKLPDSIISRISEMLD